MPTVTKEYQPPNGYPPTCLDPALTSSFLPKTWSVSSKSRPCPSSPVLSRLVLSLSSSTTTETPAARHPSSYVLSHTSPPTSQSVPRPRRHDRDHNDYRNPLNQLTHPPSGKMCFGGGSSGAVDQEAVVKNREIEKTIKADQKRAAREVKLLLLGEHSHLPIPSLQSKFQFHSP